MKENAAVSGSARTSEAQPDAHTDLAIDDLEVVLDATARAPNSERNSELLPTYAHLPERMRNAKRWLMWRDEPGRKGEKSRKIPYYVSGTKRHGELDMPEDAARLATFQQAVASLESGRWTGLGFALGPDGSGNHWQGIDLDHLSSNEAAAALVDQLPGYVETSPSGDGRHAIGYGREFAALGSNGSGIEAYSGARYFTVTGDAVRAGVITDLAPFVEQTLAPKHKGKVNHTVNLATDSDNVAVIVSPEAIADLRSALAFMRADDYSQFIANGQRLKCLGEVGRGLWIEWAQTSAKWNPNDAARWDGFKGDRTGYAAVFTVAQSAGWANPRSGSVNARPEAVAEAARIHGIDFAALVGKTPPPRSWVVDEWLPRATLTLMVGKGGVGKSLLAQQLATSIAFGKDWIGGVPEAGRVVGLFCEDDHDELWRRQIAICEHFDIPMEEVGNRLILDARAGKHNPITGLDPKGGILEAPLFHEIRRVLSETEDVKLLVLDNAAQLFVAGDSAENDRAKVTMFCNKLTGIALEFNVAVLLLAHPAKADGSEWSGSGAWDAAVRSRWILERESEEPNSRITLRRPKANYASRDGRAAFVWQLGALVRSDGRESASGVQATLIRTSEAQMAVLDAIDWLAVIKKNASDKKQASNYLPKLMATFELLAGFCKSEVAEALNALIAAKYVEVDATLWRNGNRQTVTGLKRVDARLPPLSVRSAVRPLKGAHTDEHLLSGPETDEQATLTGEQPSSTFDDFNVEDLV